MEKVCGSRANIASWTDQVLATWAGAALNMEQDVLEFLLALAKANKDILRPAEELQFTLHMLRRQAVVDSLPRTFSDREKRQLLSSPFSDVLFDSVVVARVQSDKHLAAQQRALSSVVQRVSLWVSGEKTKVQMRRSAFRSSSSSAPVPKPSTTGGSFWARGSRSGPYPLVRVDLAREVVCSPVPVGTCLQWHWREWMEVGAGEWVVKTLCYGYVLPLCWPDQ
ncbi:hypothetical protein E2C01_055113 [Portunus trituberculatus]|uniref:Uncharacterized protein n=1 Tax=Portunus trituberculatus TaxID=210409 RepID=A0A5B7GLH1_PORTR|nr:hypothetical protein [Portunus trituberculatus]